MPKKTTKTKAGQPPAVDEAAQAGMTPEEIIEAVQQIKDELARERDSLLSDLQQAGDEIMNEIKTEGNRMLAEMDQELREARSVFRAQRDEFDQEVDAALFKLDQSMATLQPAATDADSPLPDSAVQGAVDSYQAQIEAEKAVSDAGGIVLQCQVGEEAADFDAAESMTLIEGLDGDDPVAQAEEIIGQSLQTAIAAGDSLVQKVFFGMHGADAQSQDNG